MLKEFKLAQFTSGFELDFDELLALTINTKAEINFRANAETRDLTVETTATYAETIAKIQAILDKAKAKAEITPISIYQPNEQKHISVRLEFDQPVPEGLMEKLEKVG